MEIEFKADERGEKRRCQKAGHCSGPGGVIVWFQLWCGKDMNTSGNVSCVSAKKGMRGSEK